MKLSRREKKKLQGYEVGSNIDNATRQTIISKNSKINKRYVIVGILAVVVIGIVGYSISVYSRPSYYDNFAKCLNEKGVVMYGAMSWCKYTQAQKAMFGKSFNYINYKEFSELPNIKKTPTWVINGKWYENVQSFEKLSELTGCKIT